MTRKKVLLLNIFDEELKTFLSEFYKQFNISEQNLNPHITLRGPFLYKNKVSKNIQIQLTKYIDKVKNDKEKLIITGVDIFENDGLYIVFLKINDLNNLRLLARKKDYPISKYGFNPHITLFTTKDIKLAYEIKDKLDKSVMNIKCNNVEWSMHELGTRNKNLFNLPSVI